MPAGDRLWSFRPRPINDRVGLVLVCPIASRVKGYPFEVQIPDNPDLRGVVLADQVRSLDWRGRHAELIGHLPATMVAEVLQKLGTLIGPDRGLMGKA